MIELMYDLLRMAADDNTMELINRSNELPVSIKNLLAEYNRLYGSGINDYTKVEDEEGIKKDLKFNLSQPNIYNKIKNWYEVFQEELYNLEMDKIISKFNDKKVGEYFARGGREAVLISFYSDEISDDDLELMGLRRSELQDRENIDNIEGKIM